MINNLRNISKKIISKVRNSNIPQPILLEWKILEKVLGHFEGRRQVWQTRGIETEYPIGHYFEFGCYNGDSLVDFFNVLNLFYKSELPDFWKMIAFDSFKGLPKTVLKEDLHLFAGEGSYKSDGLKYVKNRLNGIGCDSTRLRLIQGFYEESLTSDLREEFLSKNIRPSLVNIDCDYYSSTMTVLNWIEPLLLDGTIIYFDDIYFYNCNPHKGELKAITDFNRSRKESGLALAPWFDVGHRCYMYWRNEDIEPKKFIFKQYVTG